MDFKDDDLYDEDDIQDNEDEDDVRDSEDENEDDIPDIPDGNNGYSQNRPWFSRNQILKVEELKSSIIVMSYCARSGNAVYYRIDGEVYSESDDRPRVKVSNMENGKVIFTCDIFLSDHGVVPYDTGLWNSSNCLLRTRSKKTKFIRLPKDLSKPAAA